MGRITCSMLCVCLILINSAPLGFGNVDVDALLSLKHFMPDPKGVFTSWDPNSVDPCAWFHITCNADNRVTRVDLASFDLFGNLSLATGLGNLDQLQYLNLYDNRIVGSIPTEIGELKNLIALDLDSNKLTGTLPPFAKMTSLKFIRLFNNMITGPVPRDLAHLPNLRVVDISNNDLCGTVPPGLEHIPYVRFNYNPKMGEPGPCP